MKKQTKKPAAKPNDVPVSKTVARPLVPAAPLPPPPEDFGKPVDPEEARINREAAAAAIEGRRHMRSAERYRLAGGVPYKGKDKRLAGSIIHDREALDAFGELAEAEEREAERCIGELRRAQEELKGLRDRKAQQDLAASNLKLAEALRASNTPPPSSSPSSQPDENAIRNHGNDPELVACVKEWKPRRLVKFRDGECCRFTGAKQWEYVNRLLHPTDPNGWVELPRGWDTVFGGDGSPEAARFRARVKPEGERRSGTGRFRLT